MRSKIKGVMKERRKMKKILDSKRIIIKVGTSTLTHENGHLDLRRIETLVRIVSDFKNQGREVVLVSSGAVSAGIARLNLDHRPRSTEEKQALAAVGQSQLMNIYERFFAGYGHAVGQILMTKDVIDNPHRFAAAESTFAKLIALGCVPIVNENDSISSEEINFGGNDTLSAYVACVCHADLLINLSDIDGLYTADPRTDPDARRVPLVEALTDEIYAMAGGAGTERGTGGMQTKLKAAAIVTEKGIPMLIANGHNPTVLYDILDGKDVGTLFLAK